MKFRPTNTLAYFNAAPQTHLHDLSDLPIAVLAEATKKYRETCGTVSPNDGAVTFYTLNHCASIVRKLFTPHETLPEWARVIMQTYTTVCMDQGERMLHYILSITTREMRHVSSSKEALWNGMTKEAGAAVAQFIKGNCANGEDSAVSKYMNNPPNATVGQYIGGMAYGFWNGWGKYTPETMENWSGGYGGPTWALVAEAARAMLTGTTSMEMLVDTGYTLAHNGGPIFNKGMMYTHYDSHFLTILDLQRAGQMLDLLTGTNLHGIKKTPEAVAAVAAIQQPEAQQAIETFLPGEVIFKGYIDWKLVDDLRPDKSKNPGKYHAQIHAQAQPTATVKPKPKTIKFHGKKAKAVGEFLVYPKQTVKIIERTGGK